MADDETGSARKPSATLNPGQVERTLTRIAEQWPAGAPDCGAWSKNFPSAMSRCCIFSRSRASALARLVRDPEILALVAASGCLRRPPRARTNAGRSARGRPRADRGEQFSCSAFVERPRNVADRPARNRRGRGLGGNHRRAFAARGDLCRDRFSNIGTRNCAPKLGSPKAQFAILGSGKTWRPRTQSQLGHRRHFSLQRGRTGHANFSNHQWFNRLATKIFETFAITGPSGALFRMDLRLRPEGSAGPLARRSRAWRITTPVLAKPGNASR